VERATLAALTAPRIEQADVEIEGVGVVTVRGLSRWEMLTVNKLADKGVLVHERAILAFGMVDPALTEEQVAQWQKVSPAAEINAVAKRINELSGVGKGAAKSDVPGDGDEPGPGV
jgi:hypothetical protein